MVFSFKNSFVLIIKLTLMWSALETVSIEQVLRWGLFFKKLSRWDKNFKASVLSFMTSRLNYGWAWWLIFTAMRLRQEDRQEFKASLGYGVRQQQQQWLNCTTIQLSSHKKCKEESLSQASTLSLSYIQPWPSFSTNISKISEYL